MRAGILFGLQFADSEPERRPATESQGPRGAWIFSFHPAGRLIVAIKHSPHSALYLIPATARRVGAHLGRSSRQRNNRRVSVGRALVIFGVVILPFRHLC
jgi:hypothetical protein